MPAGQATNPQSQQYNLALLHSLLAQAHSAGGTAAAAPRPYSAGQMLGTSQGSRLTGQPQAPILGLGTPGQQGMPARSSRQGAEQPLQQSVALTGISAAGAATQDMHSQASVVPAAQQGPQEGQASATDQANAPR